MTVAATTNTTAATSAASTAGSTVSAANMGNTSMFLQLLVAQMKNQDPTNPQNPTQMVTQLAQFNALQQQIDTNTYLQQLVNSQNANTSNATSYIGHTAVVNSSGFTYDGVTPQQIQVQMNGAATNGMVQVVDSTGKAVATLNNGALPAGVSSFTWNGIMDNGGYAPSGNYSIQVNATDANGQPVTSTAQTTGTVSAVDLTSQGVQLVVGGNPVPLSSISQIR